MRKYLKILTIFIAILSIAGCDGGISGKVNMELNRDSINTGDSTTLKVKAQNNGDEMFPGYFSLTSGRYVKVTYPDKEKLSFELHPGESVSRVFNVKGFADARTIEDTIRCKIVDNESNVIDQGDVTIEIKG